MPVYKSHVVLKKILFSTVMFSCNTCYSNVQDSSVDVELRCHCRFLRIAQLLYTVLSIEV
jgi:hypothetical protein